MRGTVTSDLEINVLSIWNWVEGCRVCATEVLRVISGINRKTFHRQIIPGITHDDTYNRTS